jgi:hypothetical protein
MLSKIQRYLKSFSRGKNCFAPGTLGDPMAEKTVWTPANGGGASFCTHRLNTINPERMEFRSSWGARFFNLIFLIFGIGAMVGFSFSMYSNGKFGFKTDTIIPILFGFVFAFAGGMMLYFGAMPIVFDRRSGHFWKGWRIPEKMLNPETLKNHTRLDQIHALQLVSECCSGSESSYYSYELNLVLQDGSRINVVDHGNVKKLREDAHMLSKFLEKPLWDGT